MYINTINNETIAKCTLLKLNRENYKNANCNLKIKK